MMAHPLGPAATEFEGQECRSRHWSPAPGKPVLQSALQIAQ